MPTGPGASVVAVLRHLDSNAEAAHAFRHFRKVGFFKHPHFVRPPALRAAVSRIEQPLQRTLSAQGCRERPSQP